jgi:glyoxylase-like metal-dependent hydrolase (beta-lactamase superfamily II)
MKIIPLKKNDQVYSCNSYLILGDWNRPDDINTIIDPGADDFVINEIERHSTGFGKIPVAQVILTHDHFDHAAGVRAIKERFNSWIVAFSEGPGVDAVLTDGQFIRAGDDILEVLHTPGHSPDSICLYAPSEKALFAGDTQVRVRWPWDVYAPEYMEAMLKLSCREIQKIYSGHDAPILSDCQEILLNTLRNISGKEEIPNHVMGGRTGNGNQLI